MSGVPRKIYLDASRKGNGANVYFLTLPESPTFQSGKTLSFRLLRCTTQTWEMT